MTAYLIRAAGHETDRYCLWWLPNRAGYTIDVSEAGRYTREEAEAQQAARPDIDQAVPLESVLSCVVRLVPGLCVPWRGVRR